MYSKFIMQSLPVDMLCYLGSFLSLSDILSLMCSSKKLARVYTSDNFWMIKAKGEFGIVPFACNNQAKLRYMNQRYLTKIGPCPFPYFNEYTFDFLYPLPPYNVRDSYQFKEIVPDIEVLRSNTRMINIPSSILGNQDLDVLIVCYNSRLCVNGDIPYPCFHLSSSETSISEETVPQRVISEELREYMFPDWINNKPHAQIFDTKFKNIIIEHLSQLGYIRLPRAIKEEDVNRYQKLWKET